MTAQRLYDYTLHEGESEVEVDLVGTIVAEGWSIEFGRDAVGDWFFDALDEETGRRLVGNERSLPRLLNELALGIAAEGWD